MLEARGHLGDNAEESSTPPVLPWSSTEAVAVWKRTKMDCVMSTRHWPGQWCLNVMHLRSYDTYVSFMMPLIHCYKQDFEV